MENRELRKDMAESLMESGRFNKELLGYALCNCVIKQNFDKEEQYAH